MNRRAGIQKGGKVRNPSNNVRESFSFGRKAFVVSYSTGVRERRRGLTPRSPHVRDLYAVCATECSVGHRNLSRIIKHTLSAVDFVASWVFVSTFNNRDRN